MHKRSGSLIIGGLAGALALGGVVCSNFGVANAAMVCSTMDGKTTCSDSASATASVTVASSCSLTSTVDVAHNAILGNGAHSDEGGIGQTTLKTVCNDPGGFAIYAIGFSNDEYGNNNMVANSGASIIPTGTAMSGSVSNWAMKLSAVTSTSTDGTDSVSTTPTIEGGFDNYSSVPSTYTKVASFDGVTDVVGASTINGSSVTTTYQAFVSSTQAAGEYVGQVKYTLVHPSSATASDITIDDVTYMQNFASLPASALASVKNSMEANTQYVLSDIRDGKQYYVAKLSDGNVWMTQNLDLDIDPTNVTLNSNNTDISTDESVYTSTGTIYALNSSALNYGYTYENGAATWIPQNYTIAYNALNSESWTNSSVYPYSYDYLDSNGSPVYPDNVVTEAAAGAHGLSGNYYNWSAAMASSDSTNATSYLSTGTKNSICPKGWRLPTAAEYTNLYNQYLDNSASGKGLLVPPLYFVRAGRVSAGNLDGISNPSYGVYWTSDISGSGASYLNFDATGAGANPILSGDMGAGRSVRCLAK